MMCNCKCGNKFAALSLPWPDGLVGCLVYHYDRASLVCSECDKDFGVGDEVVMQITTSDYTNLAVRNDEWVGLDLSLMQGSG
jgi:hypothetical protein